MSKDSQKQEPPPAGAMFPQISEEKMQEIGKLARKRTVPVGTLLFKQGEPGDSFYIIHKGKVRVYKTLEDGSEMELSVMHPGESFGEMALLTGEPRSANVVAIEETVLTVLSKNQFDKVVHDYPDISLQFVRQISRWLKKEEIKLEAEVNKHGPSISLLDFVFIAVVSLFCALIFNQANPNGIKLFPKSLPEMASLMIDPDEVQEKIKNETVLFLDARPETFFEDEHVQNAVNLPYASFEILYLVNKEEIDRADHIIIYGRTISSLYDEKLALRFGAYGYRNVSILSGGLEGWKKKGYPTAP